MASSLRVIGQRDFSGGAFPGWEDVPANGCEDIVDGLLDDDSSVFRRGGTAYKTNADIGSSGYYGRALFDGYFTAGRRTYFLLMSSANDAHLVAVDPSDDATPRSIHGPAWSAGASMRPVFTARMLVFSVDDSSKEVVVVGGHVTSSNILVSAGTITVTQGSRAVTGVGTTFTSLAAGCVIKVSNRAAVIESITNNTSLTLADAWPYATAAGTAWSGATSQTVALQLGSMPTVTGVTPVIGQAAGRLLYAWGNRIRFSQFNTAGGVEYPAPFEFTEDDFHDLPEGVAVLGLEQIGDDILVFTTGGVWAVTNASLGLTDAFANVQQRLDPLGRDIVLWGERGIASWDRNIVVPATEDVYVMGPDGSQPFTGGAGRLYREYVHAGYQPGQSAIYRGHFLLPVLDSTFTPVDLLVWRLNRRDPRTGAAPLVRWAGHAGLARAITVRAGSSTRSPVLLSAADRRVVNLTACFIPAAAVKSDATGTAHQLTITGRGLMDSETSDATFLSVVLRYELDRDGSDTPTFTAEWATGRPGSTFTAYATASAGGGHTATRAAWRKPKSAQQFRWRISTSGPAVKAVVRAVETTYRPQRRRGV